jgi:hypothetical protein
LAVATSMAASRGVRGRRPCFGSLAWNRRTGETDETKLGDWLPPRRLPRSSKATAWSKTPPAAAATPGARRTGPSRRAGTVGCVPWSLEFPSGSRGVIAVSTPLFVSVKIRSKDRLIVSVKT